MTKKRGRPRTYKHRVGVYLYLEASIVREVEELAKNSNNTKTFIYASALQHGIEEAKKVYNFQTDENVTTDAPQKEAHEDFPPTTLTEEEFMCMVGSLETLGVGDGIEVATRIKELYTAYRYDNGALKYDRYGGRMLSCGCPDMSDKRRRFSLTTCPTHRVNVK